MTELSEQDHELIRRYLAGILTDQEEMMLETRIVKDSRFRSEVELTGALQEGFRQLDAHGEIPGLLVRPRRRWMQSPAIAASLAAAVFGLLTITYFTARPPPLGAPLTVAALHFEPTRGPDAENVVHWTRKPSATQLRLHFDVGAAPALRYRVIVQRQDSGGTATISDTVEPATTDGEVVLDLRDSHLGIGDFNIRLTPISGDENDVSVVYSLTVTDS